MPRTTDSGDAASSRCRTDVVITWLPSPSMLVSTPGGGCGTGAPSRFSSIQLPRITGEVRLAVDVIVSMLPWPSNPRRWPPAGSWTLRKYEPRTSSMP